jgi:hypothetical protein
MLKILVSGMGLGSTYVGIKLWQLKKKNMNLVFDIDNTLISSQSVGSYMQHNTRNYGTPNLSLPHYMVWKRPYSEVTLYILSKFYNIHIYTAATEEYALNILEGCYPSLRYNSLYSRKEWHEAKKVKDMTLFGNSANYLLIDDKLSNHVEGQAFYHIPPYYHYNNANSYDYEMLRLLLILLIK